MSFSIEEQKAIANLHKEYPQLKSRKLSEKILDELNISISHQTLERNNFFCTGERKMLQKNVTNVTKQAKKNIDKNIENVTKKANERADFEIAPIRKIEKTKEQRKEEYKKAVGEIIYEVKTIYDKFKNDVQDIMPSVQKQVEKVVNIANRIIFGIDTELNKVTEYKKNDKGEKIIKAINIGDLKNSTIQMIKMVMYDNKTYLHQPRAIEMLADLHNKLEQYGGADLVIDDENDELMQITDEVRNAIKEVSKLAEINKKKEIGI